ncbi:MAG TPA: PLP-dependent transferase [Gemmatimonadales bacterium]|nr:PLP-dependent transferase [Gemmatimonadales bacterium]
MTEHRHPRIETLAVHAGHAPDPATGAVTPPIYLTTTFARDAEGNLPHGFIYARSDNPTRRELERSLAALEGGETAVAFASGMAAAAAVFQSMLPGEHVIAPRDAYYGTAKLLLDVMAGWGLGSTLVDMTDLHAVAAAVRRETHLIWIETPSNPSLAVTDIARVAEIAHAAGARCVCDNTWATPVLQRPLALGCDLVMHSTTKYLGGHSDLTGGALVSPADDEWVARLRTLQALNGAVPSAFDCWLLMRGIRSLPWRMRGHCENAAQVARFLASHEGVEVVHYPGLTSDAGHAVAGRQMTDFGGMVSLQVKGGAEAALEVVRRVQLFTRATSLGGPESLIEHRASVEGPESRTPPGLLRLSIGLEHADDLVQDLDQALRAPGGRATRS